jgi:hypothetical protein
VGGREGCKGDGTPRCGEEKERMCEIVSGKCCGMCCDDMMIIAKATSHSYVPTDSRMYFDHSGSLNGDVLLSDRRVVEPSAKRKGRKQRESRCLNLSLGRVWWVVWRGGGGCTETSSN